MNITEPLRLAVGSHAAGSGRGCAMNVVSWESGDTTITDLPACADPMLARAVQQVNDRLCSHREGGLLCPVCSQKMLDLAHRTVGTNLRLVGWSDLEQRRVWVRLAVWAERRVLPLASSPTALQAIEAAEAWADCPCADHARLAGDAASRPTSGVAGSAAFAASASSAYYAAYYAAYAVAHELDEAHRLVNQFGLLTGVTAAPPNSDVVTTAVLRMTEVTP